MEIRVVRGGMQTTVQDRGRRGHRGEGVPWSGAADPFALRLANALVGNPEAAAGLEFTLVGPTLEFDEDTLMATAGATCAGCPALRPVLVRAGQRIEFGECRDGCRTYLAVAGGLEVAPLLGSRSTYLRGGFGGFQGRTLRDGDVLQSGDLPLWAEEDFGGRWQIDPRILPAYAVSPTVRVLRGAQAAEFGAEALERTFAVSNRSDRMALRLEGERLERNSADELVSSAVLPGTIQVPADGQPLVLLADAQTIGGYPQLAHVIDFDLPIVAQLRPGDTVRLQETTLTEAQRLIRQRERALRILREGLAQKMGFELR